MSKIKQLPASLANQIAAGEVVERPCSVVKELLENSIDAGSQRISIDIEGGGTSLIRIRDDGSGISKEDLPLALSRHATSKLETIEDLYEIASLGFRGEALASIASVSQFTLKSRYHEAEHAWQIKTEGKDLSINIEPSAHPIGTTIEINNLFYNVPARRKFLRSPRTEFIHIEEVVKRIALANFNIGFTLKHNDKTILQLQKVDDMALAPNRIAKVFGHPFIKHAIYFEQEAHDFKLHGWFSGSELSRSQNDQQYFYINGRVVRDKLINHAIRQASQHLFPEGRFPSYVVYLTLPPSEVDVNVHPTKHEVRFREARLVHDFIFQAIHNMLVGSPQVNTSEPEGDELMPEMPQDISNFNPMHYIKTTEQYQPQRFDYAAVQERRPSFQSGDIRKPSQKLFLQSMYLPYCFIRFNDELHLLDLQAAIKLAIELEMSGDNIKAQPLLLPITINLDKKQLNQFESIQEKLTPFCVDISVISETSIAIRALPRFMKYVDWQNVLGSMNTKNQKLSSLINKNIVAPEDNSEVNKLLALLETKTELLFEKRILKRVSAELLAGLF